MHLKCQLNFLYKFKIISKWLRRNSETKAMVSCSVNTQAIGNEKQSWEINSNVIKTFSLIKRELMVAVIYWQWNVACVNVNRKNIDTNYYSRIYITLRLQPMPACPRWCTCTTSIYYWLDIYDTIIYTRHVKNAIKPGDIRPSWYIITCDTFLIPSLLNTKRNIQPSKEHRIMIST